MLKKKKEEIQISKKTDKTLHISQTESMRFSNMFWAYHSVSVLVVSLRSLLDGGFLCEGLESDVLMFLVSAPLCSDSRVVEKWSPCLWLLGQFVSSTRFVEFSRWSRLCCYFKKNFTTWLIWRKSKKPQPEFQTLSVVNNQTSVREWTLTNTPVGTCWSVMEKRSRVQ